MSNQPNILLIFPDQVRPHALGCYGNTQCLTPNIDALSENGVTFDAACSPYPVCSPARASLMTSSYPHYNGVVNNDITLEYHNIPRLAKRLSNPQYNTSPNTTYKCSYMGKWHLGGFSEGGFIKNSEYKHGFDNHMVFTDLDYYKGGTWKLINHDNSTISFPNIWRPEFEKNGAIACLQAKDSPWLITYSPLQPHQPYDKNEIDPKYNHLYPPESIVLRPNATDNVWKEIISYYYRLITWLDDLVGEIVKALHDLNMYDNTLIVFSSDHGMNLGCHDQFNKRCIYEESCRIPLIFSGGYIKNQQKGKRVSIPVGLCDIFPTLADVAGTYIEDVRCLLHGNSLIGYLDGRGILKRDSIYIESLPLTPEPEYWLYNPQRAVRTERYKYVEEMNADGEVKPVMIFDLDEDPYEMNNIINSAPESVRNMLKDKFDSWKKRTSDDWPEIS